MKLHEVELAVKKANAIAQAAGGQLKDKEQKAQVAEKKSHQAKLKFKQARKESRQARKAARRAREEADEARKIFTKAASVAAKAQARATKAWKKAGAKSARTSSHRKNQLKPVPKLKPPGAGPKKTAVPVVKPDRARQAVPPDGAAPTPDQDDHSQSADASLKS